MTNSILEIANPFELRVGNYVYGGVQDVLCIVNKILFDINNKLITINARSEKEINFEQLRPIPLTVDFLIKLGFEERQSPIKSYYHTSGIELDQNFKPMNVKCDIEVKYIHQLQNIYSSLTGDMLILH